MNATIDVQVVTKGMAKCVVWIGSRHVPFEVRCYTPSNLPLDRDQFIKCLREAAAGALRRAHHDSRHARLVGTYTVDLDVPDETPPPVPIVRRHAGVLNIEVLGNTGHVLVRFADREIALYPNKHRNISAAGIDGLVTVTPVSRDGIPGETIQVS